MKVLTIKEEMQIPGTDVILESGDRIKVIEATSTGLLATSSSLEGIKKQIASYFYDKDASDITLKPETDNVWGVYKTKSGKHLTRFQVRYYRKKYRFEEK